MICMNFSEPEGAYAEHLQAAEAPLRGANGWPQPPAAPLRSFCGTKLEHGGRECYMWITGDRPGRGTGERIGSGSKAVPREYQGDPKTMPAARAESLAGRASSIFESGER
jgi:hypothetical protein